MKHTKLLILTLLTAMTFAACGTDDSLQFRFPDQENKDDNNEGGNTNKNVETPTRMWLQPICLQW